MDINYKRIGVTLSDNSGYVIPSMWAWQHIYCVAESQISAVRCLLVGLGSNNHLVCYMKRVKIDYEYSSYHTCNWSLLSKNKIASFLSGYETLV